MVFHIDPVRFDHHALLVDCCCYERKGPKSFKFKANWVMHDSFKQIVSEGWNDIEGVIDDRVLDLIKRLDACRRKLILWNKNEFPNFRRAIDQLRHMLNKCYKGSMTAEKMIEVEQIVKQLEESWKREEIYWWQRSRVAWLSYGDRNSNFFQSSVVQRR
ncbi:hypothetical protein K1719_034201 [Acacia pycnantha]|nr:hypothetical protein K1719_034201 [Acacia pycnantha]